MSGHVECVMISDEDFWIIFVDGTQYAVTYHEHFSKEVFQRETREILADMAGVAVDDLRFSVYGYKFFQTMEATEYYCGDEYMENHSKFAEALVAHNITTEKGLSQVTFEQLYKLQNTY